MPARVKTPYPGVFYRTARRLGRIKSNKQREKEAELNQAGTERVYYIVFKKAGRMIEEKVGRQYADKMSAQKAARIRAERIEGDRLSPKEIRKAKKQKETAWTVERLFEEYKARKPHLKSFGPDENRFQKYLKPEFGKKEPKDIAPQDVDRLRVRMFKDKKSPQTVKLTLALLRRICKFGNKKLLTKPLPFDIEMPKVHNVKTEDLTPAQIKRLFKAIEDLPHLQGGQMMKLALFTGMRRGEIFKLKWKDLDFDRGFITIRDPKGGPDQTIPMNDDARELLKSIHRSKGSPLVFPGRKGKPWVTINKQLNQIKKKAKLPNEFRPLHGLRHVFASTLASSGKVDMYVLQRLLGHKDFAMTQRYAHLRDEALRAASGLAGEILHDTIRESGKGEGEKPLETEKRAR